MSNSAQMTIPEGRAYRDESGEWVYEWYVKDGPGPRQRRLVTAKSYPALMKKLRAALRKEALEREALREKDELIRRSVLNYARSCRLAGRKTS